MPGMSAQAPFCVSEAAAVNVSHIIHDTLEISRIVHYYESTKVKESLSDIVMLTMFFGV